MDAEGHEDVLSFGELLRRHRLAAGLTQEELAERATLSARGISDLERGARSRPQRETALLLADALKIQGEERADFLAARRRAAPRPAPEPVTLRVVARDPWPSALPPSPPNLLIGREAEVAAVTALLGEPGVRLLTLLGPGGIGKTRLAIAVAAAVRAETVLSVAFIPLGAILAPDLLVPTIARALDVEEVGGRTLEEQLVLALRRQPTLLALDTFEQIVAAGPVVARLLAACPSLNVLVTSRVPLKIAGEHRFPTRPLAVPPDDPEPTVESVGAAASVQLFMARARAVDPGVAVTPENAADVAAICRLLEGLPLAIELAAARVAHMPFAALLTRLDRPLRLLTEGARDAPPRHRALRDTVAWSYDLLKPEEQALLRRLGVFAGGCSLEAAEAIARADPPIPGDTADRLDALLDANLLVRREHHGDALRLGMLDTIREFALEELAATGEEEATRDAHAAYFLALAERAEPELFGAHSEVWAERLNADHGNLTAALAWHRQCGDATALGRLAATLREYWFFTSRLSEGRRWLDEPLARVAEMPSDVAGKVLWAGGFLMQQLGDLRGCVPLLEEARDLRTRVGDANGAAHCVFSLGMAAVDRGDFAPARGLLTEARDLWLGLSDLVSVAYAEFFLAWAFIGIRELDAAAASGTAAYRRAVELRSVHAARLSAYVMVNVALARGDVPDAAAWYRRALDAPEIIGQSNPEHLSDSITFAGGTSPLVSAGVLAIACGDHRRGARLFGAAEQRREILGQRSKPAHEQRGEEAVRMARTVLGEEAFLAAWATGRTLDAEAIRAEIEAALAVASMAPRRPSALFGDDANAGTALRGQVAD